MSLYVVTSSFVGFTEKFCVECSNGFVTLQEPSILVIQEKLSENSFIFMFAIAVGLFLIVILVFLIICYLKQIRIKQEN